MISGCYWNSSAGVAMKRKEEKKKEQKYCSCSPIFFAPWNVVLIVLMINGATGLPRFHLQANQLPFYELSVSTQNVEWLLNALGGDTQRSSPTKYWCKKCFLGRGSGKAARGDGGLQRQRHRKTSLQASLPWFPVTRCSILRFESGCGHHSPTFTLHTSLTLEELKKTVQAAFSSYQKSKWWQQWERFKHEHSKWISFQLIYFLRGQCTIYSLQHPILQGFDCTQFQPGSGLHWWPPCQLL